jgi:SAM-dependent methyltransferase
MNNDKYLEFAEKYDYMLSTDDSRTVFFRKCFEKYLVGSVLDCSCGTGNDLIMFRTLTNNVAGSDLSDAMIAVAKKKTVQAGFDIKIEKADFRKLEAYGLTGYDAIVCLSSSICELHSEEDTIEAIKSMYNSLNKNGILIIDQGQSDSMMNSRPRFIPVLNNREISRLFVIDYLEDSDDFITVNICDLVHTEEDNRFSLNPFRLRIRLFDEWRELMKKASIDNYEIFGNWDMAGYDKNTSKRIIIKAIK